jgi:hypothetical protein
VTKEATEAIRQVLKEAGEFRHFFDLSDAELGRHVAKELKGFLPKR